MNKVAEFISNWFDFSKNIKEGFTDRKILYKDEKFIIESLYKTAKKHFLPNHDIDFIFVTNTDIEIPNIRNIKIELKLQNFWHVCLMKILSIKYINDDYDYYFINDPDQIFIDTIDDDILKKDFVILDHWGQNIKDVHRSITKKITLDFEESKKEEKWLLGNFFGGKRKYIRDLYDHTIKLHNLYFIDNDDFYTIYPEEIFLIKYLYENNIMFSRYKVTNDENSFMFVLNEDSVDKLNKKRNGSVKLLHDTKRYHKELIKIMENYE